MGATRFCSPTSSARRCERTTACSACSNARCPCLLTSLPTWRGSGSGRCNGNFPSQRYLEGFADVVKEGSGGAITVKFSDYKAGSHCTHGLYLKVPNAIKAAALRDRDAGITEPLVDLRSGEPATGKAARAESAKKAKAFVEEAEARSDVPELARRLLYYLVLTLPLRPFAALLKPDFIKKVEAFIEARNSRANRHPAATPSGCAKPSCSTPSRSTTPRPKRSGCLRMG